MQIIKKSSERTVKYKCISNNPRGKVRNNISQTRWTPLRWPHAQDVPTASFRMDKGWLSWERGHYKPSVGMCPHLGIIPQRGSLLNKSTDLGF